VDAQHNVKTKNLCGGRQSFFEVVGEHRPKSESIGSDSLAAGGEHDLLQPIVPSIVVAQRNLPEEALATIGEFASVSPLVFG
jgi:hypothetical protein